MATATLAQLFATKTKAEILATMFADGAALGVDVVGVQAERLFRSMFEMESSAKELESYKRVQVAQAGFLSTVKLANINFDSSYIAPPNWTDLIARGFFNLGRYPAVATAGAAVLTCSAAATSGTVPAGQAIFSSNAITGGIRYRNKYAFTINPSVAIPVVLVAEVAGATGNLPVGSIVNIETTLAGCEISNPGTAGSWITTIGSDYESDDNLIARCLGRWAAHSYGGARSAYIEWVNDAFVAAAQTPTITRIGVDDGNPNGPGSTDIYLANAVGPATASELALVDQWLQARRGLGTGPLRVLAAPGLTINVAGAIYGNTNGVALGTANLLGLEAIVKPGSYVYRSTINALLHDPSIPGAYDVKLTSPLADVKLTGFQVPVFSIALTASL